MPLKALVNFSLTPTLSRWERENFLRALGNAGALEIVQHAIMRFPLPQGEGQGESERVFKPSAGIKR
jgi:hypothetical protein